MFDQQYIQEKKNLQDILLEYIDHEGNSEEQFQNLMDFFKQKEFSNNKTELKLLFRMITKIANHHYRSTDFFSKIEMIISKFKDDISKHFTNSEIFNIFQPNKRILLFLFEEKILTFTYFICKAITNYDSNYFYYFYPEITEHDKSAQNDSKEKKKEILEFIQNNQDEFKKLRKIGENESNICQLIRKDDINNFIDYIKKNKVKLDTKIEESFYETNSYINKYQGSYIYQPKLAHYACFFGSIQIFKFLISNKVQLDGSLWNYAIHGRNMEIIHILEQQKIKPMNNSNFFMRDDDSKFDKCFDFAMKNFHNDIANYIHQNYLLKNNKNNHLQPGIRPNIMQPNILSNFYQANINFQQVQQQENNKNDSSNTKGEVDESKAMTAIKYMNYAYFPQSVSNEKYMRSLCENGFYELVDDIIKTKNLDFLYEDRNYYSSFTLKDILFKVVEKEHFEILKRLYENRPFDVNLFNHDFRSNLHPAETMLHVAIKKDSTKIVQFLSSIESININQIYWESDNSSFGYNQSNKEEEDENDTYFDTDFEDYSTIINKKTALHLAIENKNTEIVSILLKHPKINVNVLKLEKKYLYDKIFGYANTKKIYKTRFIKTALFAAIENDDVEMVRLLLTAPKIDVNKKSKSDFRYVYQYHERKKKGKDINVSRSSTGHEIKTPLFVAIEKEKNIEIIKLLVSHAGIDINLESSFIENNQALLDFMKRMMNENVEHNEVVDNAIKMKSIVKTPLEMAYMKQNTEISDLLLGSKTIDVNYKSSGQQIFKDAVKNGDIEAMKSFLAIPGINVKKALKGSLQIAIQNDKIDIVKFLLTQPNINVNDKLSGKTPLQVAADQKNIEVVQLLLDRPELKYDINKVFSSIDEKQIKIISLLLEKSNK